MLMYQKLKEQWSKQKNRLDDWGKSLDLDEKIKKAKLLEKKAADPNFWNDSEAAAMTMQELRQLKDKLAVNERLKKTMEDWSILLQMYKELEDEEGSSELLEEAEKLRLKATSLLDKEELFLLFKGRYDEKNVIMSIHPGAGGLEAQDWAGMLLRMYTRWIEKKGYSTEILDLLPGEEAGLKSVTLLVKGERAYGHLQAENGIHRLVRISPFDAGGRRHTSFVSVEILPEVEEGVDLEVNPDDLRIDTFRSRGAGGQHVNTTDSAVRITHLPSGVVAQCQNERSQHSNKDRAMRILLAKLADLEQRRQKEQLQALRGEQKEIAWGNQIRSYVFHPYSLVKDHRTGVETGDIQSVMDGEIDRFLEAYLHYNACPQP
ncbi:MAG: peptide chain release factor 2 [Firmicutes bacterium]|nr:peptide chain release factor 2 [Bacillota bacterium]